MRGLGRIARGAKGDHSKSIMVRPRVKKCYQKRSNKQKKYVK